MFQNKTIAKRLSHTFLILSGLVAISGIAGIIAASYIGHETDLILGTEFPIFNKASELQVSIMEAGIITQSVIYRKEGAVEDLNSQLERVRQLLEELRLVTAGRDMDKLLGDLEDDFSAFQTSINEIETSLAEGVESDATAGDQRVESLNQELIASIDKVLRHAEDKMAEEMELADSAEFYSKVFLISIAVIAFLIALILGNRISQGIVTPLNRVVEQSKFLGAGDLDGVQLLEVTTDEIGALNEAFNLLIDSQRKMTSVAEEIAAGNLTTIAQPRSGKDTLGIAFQNMLVSLQKQIQTIVEGTSTLSSSVAEISASTAQLASSSAENASAISETTSTIEEVRQTTDLSSKKAEQMAENAHNIRETSQGGRDATKDTSGGMKKIEDQMSIIAETIIGLSQQSQSIGQIIASVDAISEQSNVLAVNASIEAAKAGEQGKGFSVVAQEVKTLAEQSKKATKQVREILNEIQKSTNTAIMATEQGNKVVEKVTETALFAGKAIDRLADSIDETSDVLTQISAASQQQRVGMDQITSAMENVNEASQQNAASAKQLETAVHNLNQLGEDLKSIVQSYRLS